MSRPSWRTHHGPVTEPDDGRTSGASSTAVFGVRRCHQERLHGGNHSFWNRPLAVMALARDQNDPAMAPVRSRIGSGTRLPILEPEACRDL